SALYWMALSSCSSMLATDLNSEIARICGAACVPLEDRAVSLVAKSTSTVAASGETGASTSAGACKVAAVAPPTPADETVPAATATRARRPLVYEVVIVRSFPPDDRDAFRRMTLLPSLSVVPP